MGDQHPSIMRLTAQTGPQPRIRPLPGVHFSLTGDALEVCRGDEEAPRCAASGRWLRAVETLRTDLFSGAQHSLLDLETPVGRFREASISGPAAEARGHL